MKKIIFQYEGDNIDLEKYLEINMPFLKYYQIKELINNKNIIINDQRINKSVTLSNLDKIVLYLDDKKINNIFNPIVIYEDENIFIVYKPIKIKSEGLFSMEYFINLNVNNHYKLVHRLDTNTDGLLIFSKKYDIYEMLKEVFIKKEIKKFYQAIIYYELKLNLKTPVTFVDYLTKFDNQSKVSISNIISRNSQEIKTIINKITPLFSNVYLFDIEIPTGKTHQIRAQLSYHNFKIMGDEKYGNILINKKFNWTTQILTFHSLQFNISNNPKLEYLNDLEITIDNMDIRSSIGSFLSSQKNIQHKLDS